MSVEKALGVSAETATDIIRRRWDGWVSDEPMLARADRDNVRRWLRRAGNEATGGVLRGLARLASVDGCDDVEAACVLAWSMLPAACRIAHDLRDVHPDIDELVASQLWIEARTVNWRVSEKVAANIGSSLRRNLVRSLGIESRAYTRNRLLILWPEISDWEELEQALPAPDARKALLKVLDWGVAHGTIQESDRALLLDMVAESDTDPKRHSPRRALLGSAAALGPRWGVTPRTIRRRGRRALDALASHADELARIVTPLAS